MTDTQQTAASSPSISTQAQCTPGPFAVMHYDAWIHMKGAPSSVCHVGEYVIVTNRRDYDSHGSDYDDAVSIARACNAYPGMLEALKRIRCAYDAPHQWADRIAREIEYIRAALSQAEGTP